MKKFFFSLTTLVSIMLAGPGTAQQGAKYEDTANGRQGFSSFDIILRREANYPSAELGPAREVVSIFDSDAFRTRETTGSGALSLDTPISDDVAAAPLVLPKDLIETLSSSPNALSADSSIDVSNIYFRESAFGLGFYYGYETSSYKLDVTARMTETSDGTTEFGPKFRRFQLNETREGFLGTVHAANINYVIEIACRPSQNCITDSDLQTLYSSLLSCETDGNCYSIDEDAP